MCVCDLFVHVCVMRVIPPRQDRIETQNPARHSCSHKLPSFLLLCVTRAMQGMLPIKLPKQPHERKKKVDSDGDSLSSYEDEEEEERQERERESFAFFNSFCMSRRLCFASNGCLLYSL